LSNEQQLPPFKVAAVANGIFSEAELDQLIADHASLVKEGTLADGGDNPTVRRSQVVMLGNTAKYQWLYRRFWNAAQNANRNHFCVDITGIEGNIQLARYDSSDQGFYGWHTDFAGLAPLRKISFSVQMSHPDDYEGGDLELLCDDPPVKLDRTRGAVIAFPSFTVHRVTPVTRGTRWSLVAWITGPRWR
jgi:predicted 2-oxoglutarate/Fe(II)-dependent dioxygenase YbiX